LEQIVAEIMQLPKEYTYERWSDQGNFFTTTAHTGNLKIENSAHVPGQCRYGRATIVTFVYWENGRSVIPTPEE